MTVPGLGTHPYNPKAPGPKFTKQPSKPGQRLKVRPISTRSSNKKPGGGNKGTSGSGSGIASGGGSVKQPKQPKPNGGAPLKPGKPHPERASSGKPGGPQHFAKQPKAPKTGGKPGGNKGGGKGKGGNAAPFDYLAPMSPQALKKQAVTTISASYKPSFGDLNSEQKQLAAINSKRAQDNKFYENWLAGKQSALLAQDSSQNAAFNAQLTQANQMTDSLFGGQQQALVAQANARQGNVSNNSQSTALGADLSKNQGLTKAAQGVAEQSAVNTISSGSDLERATSLNNLNAAEANHQSQISDFQQNMTALAAQRSKLQLSKAGDIAKEIARLQGIEIQKAQNQQQVSLAEQTLGANVAKDKADAINTHAEITAGVTKAKLAAQEAADRLKESAWEAKLRANTSLTETELRDKLGLTEAQMRQAYENNSLRERVQHDIAENKVAQARQATENWKAHHPGSGSSSSGGSSGGSGGAGSPLTINEQTGDFTTIDSLRGQINAYKKKGVSSTKIYQSLLASNNVHLLNAAFDLSDFRQGLTKKDIAKLRAMGLRNITAQGYRVKGG